VVSSVSESKQQFVFGLLGPLTFPSRWPKLPFGLGTNSRCMLQNSQLKLQDLMFSCHLLPKKVKGTRKPPQTRLYKDGCYYLTHMLRHSGIEPTVLRRSLCVVRRRRVDVVLVIS